MDGETPTSSAVTTPTATGIPEEFAVDPMLLLHAVADDTRWRILRALATGGPMSVLEIAAATSRQPDLISKHLKTLRKAGAVIWAKAPDADQRKQFYTVPERFLRPAETGKATIDYGICLLRFR